MGSYETESTLKVEELGLEPSPSSPVATAAEPLNEELENLKLETNSKEKLERDCDHENGDGKEDLQNDAAASKGEEDHNGCLQPPVSPDENASRQDDVDLVKFEEKLVGGGDDEGRGCDDAFDHERLSVSVGEVLESDGFHVSERPGDEKAEELGLEVPSPFSTVITASAESLSENFENLRLGDNLRENFGRDGDPENGNCVEEQFHQSPMHPNDEDWRREDNADLAKSEEKPDAGRLHDRSSFDYDFDPQIHSASFNEVLESDGFHVPQRPDEKVEGLGLESPSPSFPVIDSAGSLSEKSENPKLEENLKERVERVDSHENSNCEEDHTYLQNEAAASKEEEHYDCLQLPVSLDGYTGRESDAGILKSEDKFDGRGHGESTEPYDNSDPQKNSSSEGVLKSYAFHDHHGLDEIIGSELNSEGKGDQENTGWKDDDSDYCKGPACLKEEENSERIQCLQGPDVDRGLEENACDGKFIERLQVGGDNQNKELESTSPQEGKWVKYPQRSREPDCVYYLRTGNCGYGANCKFNHPSYIDKQARPLNTFGPKKVACETIKEVPEWVGHKELKLYTVAGDYKYGSTFKHGHGLDYEKNGTILELNFSGLPLRPGMSECTYYMRTGICKFGINCRFNHPNPSAGGGNFLSVNGNGGPPQLASEASQMTWMPKDSQPFEKKSDEPLSSSNASNCNVPTILFPPHRLHPTSDLSNYQAPLNPSHSSESTHHPLASTLTLKADGPHQKHTDCQFFMKSGHCKFGYSCKFSHHSTTNLNKPTTVAGSPFIQQTQMEEYPERPGEPECAYFMKHGDCKFKSACKFHHPSASIINSPTREAVRNFYQEEWMEEHPERPGELECPYFMRHGTCKFKYACKFHHPSVSISNDPTRTPDSPKYQKAQMLETVEYPHRKFHHPSVSISNDPTRTPDSPKYQKAQMVETVEYPHRPGEPLCPHFMKHMNCNFGPACKFHHPSSILNGPTTKAYTQKPQMYAYQERPSELECPYFTTHGYCKFQTACMFHHPSSSTSSGPMMMAGDLMYQQTPMGEYPQKPGEPECSYFMKHGSCKFRHACKFHHPSASTLSNPVRQRDGQSQQLEQMEQYPERPGEPECTFFMKFGSCKLKSDCKFHHPKFHIPTGPPCVVSRNGLPLRPDKPVCLNYKRFGTCKFGPYCNFDHPIDSGFVPSEAAINSSQASSLSEFGTGLGKATCSNIEGQEPEW